jgi:tetratricopeptide (TPR) repeat protein
MFPRQRKILTFQSLCLYSLILGFLASGMGCASLLNGGIKAADQAWPPLSPAKRELFLADSLQGASVLPGRIAMYRKWIQADPFSGVNYYNLGVVYDRSGRASEAMDAYAEAIQRDRLLVDAYFNLAYDLMLIRGDYRKAYEYLAVAGWLEPAPDIAHNAEVALSRAVDRDLLEKNLQESDSLYDLYLQRFAGSRYLRSLELRWGRAFLANGMTATGLLSFMNASVLTAADSASDTARYFSAEARYALGNYYSGLKTAGDSADLENLKIASRMYNGCADLSTSRAPEALFALMPVYLRLSRFPDSAAPVRGLKTSVDLLQKALDAALTATRLDPKLSQSLSAGVTGSIVTRLLARQMRLTDTLLSSLNPPQYADSVLQKHLHNSLVVKSAGDLCVETADRLSRLQKYTPLRTDDWDMLVAVYLQVLTDSYQEEALIAEDIARLDPDSDDVLFLLEVHDDLFKQRKTLEEKVPPMIGKRYNLGNLENLMSIDYAAIVRTYTILINVEKRVIDDLKAEIRAGKTAQ